MYIVLPVLLTPGNTFKFQLGIFKLKDYLLFLFLSLVTALLIIMQVYIFVRSKKERAGAVSRGGVGIFSALFAGLLATAACSSCILAIFGFLGAGSIFFTLGHQSYFVYGGIVLVLISLYFSSRRVQGYCENCKVKILSSKK